MHMGPRDFAPVRVRSLRPKFCMTFRNRLRALAGSTPSVFIDGNRESNLSGVENNQLDWFVRRETSMRRLDGFRYGLAWVHNRALAGRFFLERQFPRQHITNADHRVVVPMQSSVGRNRDPEHCQLWLSSRIALVVNAIPRLCRLQNLLHLDLWLARTQQSRDQPKGKGRKEFQKR
jgi:hypothetical protein